MKEVEKQNEGDNTPYLTISELSQALKVTVEGAFEFVRVRAEVSSPKLAPSGHLYFTLKDERSTLAAVSWRTMVANLAVQPEEGLEVIASGKLTTYSGQSKYQIIVGQLEVAGEGALLKQLEDRRRRLSDEGLFDSARKKPIPKMPSCIGIITSPTGAVISDMIHRLRDRFGVRILVWGTLVQGRDAVSQLATAVRGFNSIPKHAVIPRPDLLIIARGGGSLEDLWAFNEEELVRSVSETEIPVISAIGHETDTTLIDFVSDLRAPTPSAAAEMAVPVKNELVQSLREIEVRLTRAVINKRNEMLQRLRLSSQGLADPLELVQQNSQILDYTLVGFFSSLEKWLGVRELWLSRLSGNLRPPEKSLAEARAGLKFFAERFEQKISYEFEVRDNQLTNLASLLDANSFERVLDRGFAIITDAGGKPVKKASGLKEGDRITLKFSDSQRVAIVCDDLMMSRRKKQKKLKSSSVADQDQLF